MNPLPGEQTLVQAGSLTVTTHRVRQEQISWGAARTIGIMLEDVSSCALLYRSYYGWLILAVIAVLGGLGGSSLIRYNSISAAIGLVAALVFAGLFFLTRRQALLISSAGGLPIVYVLSGADRTQALQIIDTIEAAKDARATSFNGQATTPTAFPSASLPAFNAPQPATPPIASQPAMPPLPPTPQPMFNAPPPIAPLPVMPPVPPAARNCRVCGKPMASPTSKFCQACGSPQ